MHVQFTQGSLMVGVGHANANASHIYAHTFTRNIEVSSVAG